MHPTRWIEFGVVIMIGNVRKVFGFLLALTIGGSVGTAQPESDPVYDGKKASEWVSIVQNDASARKRAIAVVALGRVYSQHQYKDAISNIGRSLRIDTSSAVRTQAAVVIAGLKPEDVKPIETDIVDALKGEKEARVRKELSIALSRFPEVAKKAVEPLIAVLKDADPAARIAAAEALAKAGGAAKSASTALLPLLNDPDKPVRQSAIFALGRITPDNPTFVAASLVKRFGEEKEAELRRETLVSLKLLGEKSDMVVNTFTAALADPDEATRSEAVQALGTFGTAAKPAADALLKLATQSKDKNTRIDAVRSFGSALGSGLKERLNDLIRLMENDPDFEVRLAVVEEIGALGNEIQNNKEAMTALRKRQSDTQVKVREAAAAAIRRVEKKPEKPTEKKPK